MDSVSQIALGSALTIATMGRRTAVWKSAFWGLVAGTLPDFDVFIDHGNALANMINHRGNSHSLLYLLLLAPLLGWCIARLQGEGAHWRRWSLAMALVLVTHPILDWFTVYGTQLLRPFSREAYGLGSVFVIDPLYTLPLLIGVGVALCRKSFAGLRGNQIGLLLSSLYLAWSVLAQQHVGGVARASLAAQGIAAPQLLVTPTPLNTLLWRVVAMDDTHYWEGYHSVFDKNRAMAWTRHERGTALQSQYAPHAPAIAQLAHFADGFMKLEQEDDALYLSDLRMGSEGRYSFRFRLGSPEEIRAGRTVIAQQPLEVPVREALIELWQRIWHKPE